MKIKSPSYGNKPIESIPQPDITPKQATGKLPGLQDVGDIPDELESTNTSPRIQKPSTTKTAAGTIPPLPTGKRPTRVFILVPPVGVGHCIPEHLPLQMPTKWAAYEIPGSTLIGQFDSEEGATVWLREQGYQEA